MSAAPPRPPRNRLATVTFVVVALGALLAVFPVTAPFGFLLCLVAILPAIVAFARRRRAGRPRLALAALVMAPVFLVVAAGMTSTLPRPAPAASPSAGTINAAVAAPARPTTTDATAAATAPVDPTTAAVVAAAPVDQQVIAPAPATSAPRVAPQPLAAPAKKAAPAAVAAPAPVKAAAPAKAAAPKTTSPPKAKAPPACDTSDHYVNSSGNCVPRPVQAATAPSGASAKCKDGTYSFSQHRSGTCSGHGGVAQWLKDLP